MKRITKIEAAKAAKRKLRVAAYARVSTDSAEQLVSLETQKNHYERYIQARPDWEYAGLYYDEGITGTKMEKRDGLLRMLADCDRGLIDYIIVKSISRFSRNTVESIETVRQLCDKGIFIYFEKEKIDTGNMEGELMLSILSSLAESESHSIAENYKWAMVRRFQEGTYKIGYPPYGYDNVDGQMVINQEQAKTVRWIFDAILSGKSPAKAAKELNEKGIPTKRNGKWTGHTIHDMLVNEKYTGDVLLQKTYTDDRFTRHYNHGEKNQYFIPNHHEAIVSHEVFDAANAVIEQNRIEKGICKGEGKCQNRYAMSGKVLCGICGGKMKRVKLRKYYAFACCTHLKDKDACSMTTVPEEPVKAAFVTMMNKLTWGRSRILLPYSDMLRNSHAGAQLDRMDELEELLEQNAERRQQIHEFFARGLLDPAVYEEKNGILTKEADGFAAEQKLLQERLRGSQDYQKALESLLKYTAKGMMLTEFDDALFTEHVDHIEIYERTEIGFAMKCGLVLRERI